LLFLLGLHLQDNLEQLAISVYHHRMRAMDAAVNILCEKFFRDKSILGLYVARGIF